MLRKVLYKILSSSNIAIEKYRGNSSFGCDDRGRDVESGIYKYAELLKRRNLKIHTILVLGSRTKGTWIPESDVDVTIISSSLPKKGRNLISKRLYDLKVRFLFSDRPLYLGIEPSVCLTKEEFLKNLDQVDIQALDAIFYGRIIYDDGFWQMVKERYKELERKYRLDGIPLKEKLRVV